MATRPEDILPDGDDTASVGGKVVRKGTIAAFLANIEVLESEKSTDTEKQSAKAMMQELAPSVVAIGLHKHVIFKNKEAEQMLKGVD